MGKAAAQALCSLNAQNSSCARHINIPGLLIPVNQTSSIWGRSGIANDLSVSKHSGLLQTGLAAMQHGANSLCHTHANEIFTWLQRSFINNQSQGSFGHSDGWWYVCMPLYDFHVQLPKHCDVSSNILRTLTGVYMVIWAHKLMYMCIYINTMLLTLQPQGISQNQSPSLRLDFSCWRSSIQPS